jgi:3-phenylpropionate/trans-cinnamate dioxygenase ferredoxin reductase subunit
MTTIVVVGAGVAGATAALTLRGEGFAGRVVLIGDEPAEPYRRPPLSKDVLRGTTPEHKIRLRPSEFWGQQDIELRTGTSVTDLDPGTRTISLSDGAELGYDKLLLATGGRPRSLPQAAGLRRAHTLRAVADVPALRSALGPDRRLLVIGAGLIGAEVAASARGMGVAVTMLEAAPSPLGRLLPPRIAEVYAALHREHGVELHTGVALERMDADGEGIVAVDRDGRHHRADCAVIAIGMRPCTELAEKAGLVVDDGIVVDEFGATSAPAVFAAGDVANQPNLTLGGRHRVEHWQNAQEHGAATARNMLGARTPFDRVPWCWSEQYKVNLQVCGWPEAGDDLTVRGRLDELDFTALFHRAGRLVGAVGVNRAAEIRTLRQQIAEDPYAVPA